VLDTHGPGPHDERFGPGNTGWDRRQPPIGDAIRALGPDIVARAIEEHLGDRDVHALVLGDFDAAPDSAGMRFWRG
jgi:hypothetical protein